MKKYIYFGIALFLAFFFLFNFEVFTSKSSKIDTKRAQSLYREHCSQCHRNNGDGIRRVYPPLKNADYVRNATTIDLLRGMIFGRSGTIVVNGVKYNGVMTTEIDESLNDSDIALILSYVYQHFNNMDITVSVEEVRQARKAGKLPSH